MNKPRGGKCQSETFGNGLCPRWQVLKITEKLVFMEPGVVYYFDDGSTVNTIRKANILLILIYTAGCAASLFAGNKMKLFFTVLI